MRRSNAIRGAAGVAVVVGVAAPLVRRRLGLRPWAVLPLAAAAPMGLCVALPRSRARDVGACVLQMWAYLAAYEMPHDDPEALERRVRVRYPVAVDRVLGLGTLPTLRLQRRLANPDELGSHDLVLTWSHWIWFFVPHGTVAYTLVRRPAAFPRAAALTYAVFDIGVIVYWALPTAPPWYAAGAGVIDTTGAPALRRLMVEQGERFWRDRWTALYSLLAGNPLAAMPSLHFATTVMAAHLLSELGPGEAAVGWTYAAALGLALVYLGEHYVVDLLAGAALTESIRRLEPRAAPAVRAVAARVAWLNRRALGAAAR